MRLILTFWLLATTLFACTNSSEGQVIKTGSIWTPVALNKEAETVNAFVTCKNGRIIAGTSAGLLFSDDKGSTWKKTSVGAEAQSAVFSLTKDDAGWLFAGLSKYGILVSKDNGATWTLYSTGLNMDAPRSSSAILAAGNLVFKGTFESGLYVSADKGKTWQPNNNGIPLNLLTNRMVSVNQLAKSGNTIYALTDLGLRWSADNGKSFNKPAHHGIERLGYMTSIAADGKILYTGVTLGNKGVFCSTDNGENWKPAGLNGKAAYALAIINGKLFAGAEGQIYSTADQGKTWIPVGKGLPANAIIYSIGLSPDGRLLAGLNRGGIYVLK